MTMSINSQAHIQHKQTRVQFTNNSDNNNNNYDDNKNNSNNNDNSVCVYVCVCMRRKEGTNYMLYFTTHSTHFIYGYMASRHIW